MSPEQFESMLQAWGRCYGERRGPEWQEVAPDHGPAGPTIHPLARAQQFAHKTRRSYIEARIHGRDGTARRALMGAAAGVAIVPAAFVDPVPCVETREAIGTPRPDPRYTDAVRAVQDAWNELRKWWPLQAEVVRLQYQVRGYNQAEKAELVSAATGDKIGAKRFKDELRLARTWLHARVMR